MATNPTPQSKKRKYKKRTLVSFACNEADHQVLKLWSVKNDIPISEILRNAEADLIADKCKKLNFLYGKKKR